MIEEYVSFEIATFLKDKGFNFVGAYDHESFMIYKKVSKELVRASTINCMNEYIFAPTLSLAQKFLRDKCNLIITIFPIYDDENCIIKYDWAIYNSMFIPSIAYHGQPEVRNFSTYEDALKNALEECIKIY